MASLLLLMAGVSTMSIYDAFLGDLDYKSLFPTARDSQGLIPDSLGFMSQVLYTNHAHMYYNELESGAR